ncbi:hypothetical protein ACIOD1_12800 [Streptomyces sp. NPDC088097]|uniref:zinc finger domain-containing protein n=1 Tax=Streptomyces sp. NPDC088097 TaxID=3365823 RepID=UPI003830E883
MNPEEIPQLLKQVSYADPRVLPDDEHEIVGLAALWAEVLKDVPAQYAMYAVGKHYAISPFPIKPSDISTRWQAVVRDRMNRDADPEPPGIDPDDEEAYRTQLAARRLAVAQGHTDPVQARELTAVPEDVQQRLKQIGRYIPDHVREQLAAHRPQKADREAAVRRGQADPLSVSCPWCDAAVDQACRGRRVTPGHDPESKRQGRRAPHPSRIDAARAHLHAA